MTAPTNSLAVYQSTPKDDPKPEIDWSAVPVMEDVIRFIAGGKAWAVQEIKMVSEYHAWEEVTIIGVRPSEKVEGMLDLVEIRAGAPRRNFGEDLSGGAQDWNPPAHVDQTPVVSE